MSKFHFVVAYDSDTRTWEQAPELLTGPVYDGVRFRDPKPAEFEFSDMLERVVERTIQELPTP